MLLSFLDKYLWVELQSYKVTILNFLKNDQTVFESSCIFFHSHQQYMSFHIFTCAYCLVFFFLYYNHPSRWTVVSHCGLTCFSLIVFFFIFFQEMFLCPYFCWVICLVSEFQIFLPIWMPFIFSSCLISLTIASSTMLNKCSKSRHFCLAPNFRRKAFSISKNEVSCESFTDILYLVEEDLFYS